MARRNEFSIELPCGRGGFNANRNVDQVPINDLIIAKNIRYDGFTWTKAPGLALFDENAISGTPSCLAGYDWAASAGVRKQITVWDNGNVYKEASGDIDGVTLKSGLSFTQPVTLVKAGGLDITDTDKLYMFSKGVAPQVLEGDGATMSGITNEAADWSSAKPGHAVYHDTRLIAMDSDAYPHNIYISSLLDNGDFTASDARVYAIQPGIGDKCVAGISLVPTQLLIFKNPVGIVVLDTSDLIAFGASAAVLRDDIGAAGPHCVTKVDGTVFFISPNGRVYALNAMRPDISPEQGDVTANLNLIDFITRNVDASRLNHARLIYDEVRKEMWYIYTSKEGTLNDSAIVFDFSESGKIKASTDENRGEVFEAAWLKEDDDGFRELLVGGEGGVVYRANASERSIGASGSYRGELRYPDTDLSFVSNSLKGQIKRFDFLEVTSLPAGTANLKYDVFIDGRLAKSGTIALDSGGAKFNQVQFNNAIFGGNNLTSSKIELDLWGNRIGLRFYNVASGENFSLANVIIHGKLKGEYYET